MRGGVYSYEAKAGRRWRVVFDTIPDPATGERRQTTKRGFRTKKAAEAFLRDALTKVETGLYSEPSRVTLREYLDTWLAGLSLKPTTMADYEQSARVYVNPRLGGMPLAAVTPEHLDGLYRELERQGKRAGKCRTAGVTCSAHDCGPEQHDGLAPKTVRNVHGMLHRALQDAAERGHLPRNVASLAHPPSARQARSSNSREKAWDREQLNHFLAVAASHRLRGIWRLAATTGARRGELLGLRWSDIDLLEGKVLYGAQTLTAVRGRLVWQGDGKSDAATRVLSLDVTTVEELRAHRERQAHERRAAGSAWVSDDHGSLVCTTRIGRAMHPSQFYRSFLSLAREALLPRLDVHGLRHTYATAALRAGISPEIVSKRLGHADVAITLRLYAHVLPRDDQTAATLIADFIDLAHHGQQRAA